MPILKHSIPNLNQLPNPTSPSNWRAQIKQKQLVSQISSLLLQRRNWVTLLRNFNLSAKITPSLFRQILLKTQKNPQISLSFFNWVKTNLPFQPDLSAHSQIIRISIHSRLFQPAKLILDPLIETHQVSQLVDSLIHSSRRGNDSESPVLGFILECCSSKGLVTEALEVFRRMIIHGHVPSLRATNAILDSLQRAQEIKLAWCVCGALIRRGVCPDYARIAQFLGKNGKLERAVRLLDMGLVCDPTIYELVIDCYSESGNFPKAFHYLNEMRNNRKFGPGFATYISILEGACKYENEEVVQMVLGSTAEKGLLPILPEEYDWMVQKTCNLGRTHAAQMYFKKAQDEKIELDGSTHGCMLRALAKKGRVKEAIGVYRVILEKGVTVGDSCYHAFVNVLCEEEEDPSEEVTKLVGELIREGFSPCGREVSKFIASLCTRHRWVEADDLVKVIIEKGVVPDSFCCCALMEHYCRSGQIDSAIALHEKMKKVKGGSLDVATYNVLLNGLFGERRIEDAISVFDSMTSQNLLSSSSFTTMISGLCRQRQFREAMKFHDQMLKLGLKPDRATYKRVISGFKCT